MALLLAGDIGGTKTILQWVEVSGADRVVRFEREFPSGAYGDLVPLVQEGAAMAIAAGAIAATEQPVAACFGIAGPVSGGASRLTNLGWFLEEDRLSLSLKIPRVELINDFAAVGYGVTELPRDRLHLLRDVPRNPDAPVAVIGAGTGLGEGFLVPTAAGSYRVFSTEGGHGDFAPRSELEWQLVEYLLERHGIDRVSVERVVSGQGIAAIYQFLRDRGIGQESPDIAAAIRTWEQQMGKSEKTVDPAAVISQAAIAGTDSLCEQAMNLFVAAYGAEAGNLALKLLPYGGLYIAGGIAAKNLPLLDRAGFMHHFETKGRVSRLLESVPVAVVLDPQVGLLGAAVRAQQLLTEG